jgi:FtsZ-interacting cell division protein ZipA
MTSLLIIGLAAIIIIVFISFWSTETPTDAFSVDEKKLEDVEGAEQETVSTRPPKTETEVRDEKRYYEEQQD